LGFYKALEAGYPGVPLDEDGSDDEGPEANEDAVMVTTNDDNSGREAGGLYSGQGTIRFYFACNEFFPSKLPAMWMADQRIGTVELCMAYFDARQFATQNYIGLGYPLRSPSNEVVQYPIDVDAYGHEDGVEVPSRFPMCEHGQVTSSLHIQLRRRPQFQLHLSFDVVSVLHCASAVPDALLDSYESPKQ
jgi:hypothetical protein